MSEISPFTVADLQSDMQSNYSGAQTLGECFEIAVRRAEPWAVTSFAEQARRHRSWQLLVDTAAVLHPDWIIRVVNDGSRIYRPRKRAAVRTKIELVKWLVVRNPDAAINISDS